MKLRQEDIQTLPVSVVIEVLAAAALCMIGVLLHQPMLEIQTHELCTSHVCALAEIQEGAMFSSHSGLHLDSVKAAQAAGSLSLAGEFKPIHASANQE